MRWVASRDHLVPLHAPRAAVLLGALLLWLPAERAAADGPQLRWKADGGAFVWENYPIVGSGTAAQFYSYGSPDAASANTPLALERSRT
ncbi:MAG: hypothetical protein M5U28_05825 [Sandaracinaceae bacterium]|nr:hypothetical protein [Sandaracinaceae bacterium]